MNSGARMEGQDNLCLRVLGIVCSLPERISTLFKGAADKVPHVLREQ